MRQAITRLERHLSLSAQIGIPVNASFCLGVLEDIARLQRELELALSINCADLRARITELESALKLCNVELREAGYSTLIHLERIADLERRQPTPAPHNTIEIEVDGVRRIYSAEAVQRIIAENKALRFATNANAVLVTHLLEVARDKQANEGR